MLAFIFFFPHTTFPFQLLYNGFSISFIPDFAVRMRLLLMKQCCMHTTALFRTQDRYTKVELNSE